MAGLDEALGYRGGCRARKAGTSSGASGGLSR
jgi:hypothetical protein